MAPCFHTGIPIWKCGLTRPRMEMGYPHFCMGNQIKGIPVSLRGSPYGNRGLTRPRFHTRTGSVTNLFQNRVCVHLGIEEKIPIWEYFPFGDRRFHMVIPIWKRAGRLSNSYLGTPHSKTEFVPIWGLTNTATICK